MTKRFRGRACIYLCCFLTVIVGCVGVKAPTLEGKEQIYPQKGQRKLTVGALYYIWWGLLPGEKDMWRLGHSLSPSLGEYSSMNPDVAERHIKWATEYGINLFEVSWSGPGQRNPKLDNDEIDAALRKGLLAAPSIGKIKFLLVYETERALIQEAEKIGYNIKRAFMEDILYANERYFNHPGYFTFGGRPVVMVWKAKDALERLLKENGDELRDVLSEAEKRAQRDILWVSLGEDVYNPDGPSTDDPILNTLDAVAPLLGDTLLPEEVKNWRRYLDRLERGYGLWEAAGRKLGFVFIPSAIPGFDDRAFSLGQDRLLKMDPDGFYRAVCLAKTLARKRGNWISIYGFNEWFESGAIEPTDEFGLKFLEKLKEAVEN